MAASNREPNVSAGLLGPAEGAEAVTKSDVNELTYISKRLWVGGAGDVAVVFPDGSSAIYTAVPAGTYLHIRVKQVKSTGTSATNIVSEY